MLIHFWSMLSFFTPWKHQKIKPFLIFSEATKWEHWLKVNNKDTTLFNFEQIIQYNILQINQVILTLNNLFATGRT